MAEDYRGLTDAERRASDDLSAVLAGKVWCVDMICCGRDDGRYYATEWDAADRFREAYCSGPSVNDGVGHERSGVIRRLCTEARRG